MRPADIGGQRPEISFIVPCFNYGRYLAQCLDSILGQQGEWNLEILVIDDASTDDSWERLQPYIARGVRALRNESNLGHAATLTRGLHEVRGDLVARIDPDDRLKPHFLRSTVALLRAHPEVALVYADAALIDDAGRETQARCDDVHGGAHFKGNEFVRLLQKNFICAPTVIARREAWLEALPIPAGLAFNDWHFTTMMARRHDFYYVNDVVAEYRVHGANLHSEIARSGREEACVLQVLDRFFSEVEHTAELESAKRRARRAIYGAQYADFARKYFGTDQYANARRCYLKAASYRPALLLSPEVLRHLLATMLGPRAYQFLKSRLRRANAKSPA